jgi:glycosyltransferase involved in cell wall biosynthesis
MKTLLGHGDLGLLVEVGDERALAEAIATVRPGSQDAQKSLALAQRFTIESACETYLSTMSRLCLAQVTNDAR